MGLILGGTGKDHGEGAGESAGGQDYTPQLDHASGERDGLNLEA